MISWSSSQMTMEISYSSQPLHVHPLHMLAPCIFIIVVDLDYSSHSTVYNMNMHLRVTRACVMRGLPCLFHYCCRLATSLDHDCSALSAQHSTLTTCYDFRNPTTTVRKSSPIHPSPGGSFMPLSILLCRHHQAPCSCSKSLLQSDGSGLVCTMYVIITVSLSTHQGLSLTASTPTHYPLLFPMHPWHCTSSNHCPSF